MREGVRVSVVIPALNEEASIGKVLDAIPDWVDEAVVCDNRSEDRTPKVARAHGARVVVEYERGYGAACLAAMAALSPCEVVVFLDADFSDRPEEMGRLVDPIVHGEAEMVIGSRVLGEREPGALAPQARFGNWLACALMRLIWRADHTDLGPFRAIRADALRALHMADRNYGWTVEMQIKAARAGLRVIEAPVSYRRRIGTSKITGTVRGVVGAGTKILYTIFRYAIRPGAKMRWPHERVIVFSRYPEPGTTKTRLIPALGPEGAAELQRQMTQHNLDVVRRLARGRAVDLQVRFGGGDSAAMAGCFGTDLVYCEQGSGGLGARMAATFRQAFSEGRQRAVIIGTDCPGITRRAFDAALDALRTHDLVLGPASDGGYTLIGCSRFMPELFDGPNWGAETVFNTTCDIARSHGRSLFLLDALDDVDRPEDLGVWRNALGGDFARRISVIIPTLNESERLSRSLGGLHASRDLEVIVVDGGSTDDTVAIAHAHGARVVTTEAGRGRQMNAGAAAARGDVLLFLHADTTPPAGFERAIRDALAAPETVAGAFALRIDAPDGGLRVIERLVSVRSRVFGLPYGDQGLFMRAATFRDMGGFADMAVMEDVDMVRRLRRKGRIAQLRLPVRTCPRRWHKLGILRTTLVNQVALMAHLAGVSPGRIARLYGRDAGLARDGDGV